MANNINILDILTYPDPRLNLKAEPVTEFVDKDSNLQTIIDNMFATMYEYGGCGLASIQVNIQKSIVVMDISRDGKEPRVFINPEIIKTSGKDTCEEGCLSFPGLRIQVTRPAELTVRAQDATGKFFELEADGLLAKCIHHECEHLAGEVFIKDLSRLKLNMALKKLKKYG